MAQANFKFLIEAHDSDPRECEGYHDDTLVHSVEKDSRKEASERAVRYLKQGYWVEVYDVETKELLAGTLSPDEAIPSYIV